MKRKIIKLIKTFYLQVLFVFLAFAAMVVVSNVYVRRIVREQMSSYSEKTISSAEYEIMSILSQYEITLNDFAFSTEFMIANGSTQEEIQAFLSSGQTGFIRIRKNSKALPDYTVISGMNTSMA